MIYALIQTKSDLLRDLEVEIEEKTKGVEVLEQQAQATASLLAQHKRNWADDEKKLKELEAKAEGYAK